jgi:peptide/nickel transport system substrate-binding protein
MAGAENLCNTWDCGTEQGVKKHVLACAPQELIVYDPNTHFWQEKMKVALVVLLFIMSLAFGGCSESADQGQDDSDAHAATEPVVGIPEYGGRIIEASLGGFTSLIPGLSTDAGSSEVQSKIYVSALKYDKNINLVPYAAKSFEVLDGGKHLKFVLRKDIRWFDGEPLTARDVEFTYRLMIDPKTPTAYAADWKAISEFRLTGPYSFEVFYDQPFARGLVTWAHDILPEHALAGEDLSNTRYSREPLGAGPYKLKEWIPGRRLVLEANDVFFQGRPYIERIIYREIPDLSTQFLELEAGNIDMMGLTPLQYLRQTRGSKWDRYRKFKYLSFGYTYLGFNFRHPFFQDVRVRRAIDMAIDKQEIVKGVLMGMGVPAVGPYKPGTWQFDEDIRDRGYHPEQARKLLAQAGWRDTDGDGLLDKDGKPFYFTILTNQGNSQRSKAGVIIQERLRDIGIRVDIRIVEWAAFLHEFVDKGRFDAVILSWNILQDPDLYDVWHSSKVIPDGLNFISYANDELDSLLERGRRLVNKADRKKIYDRVQEILFEDQPYVFLYIPYSLPIVNARVQGIKAAPAGIGYNYTKWWIPKKMQMQQ